MRLGGISIRSARSPAGSASKGVGGVDYPVGRILPGIEGHDMTRHREAPPGGAAPEPRLGDQLGERFGLHVEIALLRLPAVRPAALVPAEGAALRHQQPAAHLHPPGELGIFAAIAGERLVEAAGLVEQCPGDTEIVTGHGAEEVRRAGR